MIRTSHVRQQKANEPEEQYLTYLAELLGDVSNTLINKGFITDKQYEHIGAAANRVKRKVINIPQNRGEA